MQIPNPTKALILLTSLLVSCGNVTGFDSRAVAVEPEEVATQDVIAIDKPYVTMKIDSTIEKLNQLEQNLLSQHLVVYKDGVTVDDIEQFMNDSGLALDMFQFPEMSPADWRAVTSLAIKNHSQEIRSTIQSIHNNWQGYSLKNPFSCEFCISPETPGEMIQLVLEYDQIVSRVSAQFSTSDESAPIEKLRAYIVYSIVEDTYRYTAGEALLEFLSAAIECDRDCSQFDTQENWEAANILIKHSIVSPEVHDPYRVAYLQFAARTGADHRGLYTFEDFLSVWGQRDGQLLGSYFGCDEDGYAVFDPPLTDEEATIKLRAENGFPTIDQELYVYNSSGHCS